MPPEYCEYGPDYETHCLPWLKNHHPDVYTKLRAAAVKKDGAEGKTREDETADDGAGVPTRPWTTKERLCAFYSKYMPEKLDSIPALLEKYEGKEDKLFTALVKKYGPEPEDPYYVSKYGNLSDDDDDDGGGGGGDSDGDGDAEGKMSNLSVAEKKKRRGAGAKKVNKVDTRVVIQKISRNKKKAVTMVVGMDTVPDVKLKDVAKAFSKRFAGSSSVKDMPNGSKEIIIQGDHQDEVAAMIVEKFKVPADAVFLDIDGEFVPFKR